VGFTVALLLCETGLRLYVASRGWTPNCYATGLTFFVPDENAGHTLRPNLVLRSSAYDIQTNSFGLRGVPIQKQKPEDVYRIAVLGGSSVFGYLVPEGQDSCCVLEELLNESGGWNGKKVEVLNGGVPGFNMTQVRHRYEQTIAPLDPDLVILYLGWNDSKLAIAKSPQLINQTPPAPSWRNRLFAKSTLYGLVRFRLFPAAAPQFAPPADASTQITAEGAQAFRNDLKELLASIRRSGAQAVISTQLMAANPGCENLDRYLGETPQQIETNQMIGRWITQTMRDVAAESSTPLFDVANEVPCQPDLLGDAIHLTREGHRQVAVAWANDLAAMQP
jgi:lysophospholipase L1-like esterase